MYLLHYLASMHKDCVSWFISLIIKHVHWKMWLLLFIFTSIDNFSDSISTYMLLAIFLNLPPGNYSLFISLRQILSPKLIYFASWNFLSFEWIDRNIRECKHWCAYEFLFMFPISAMRYPSVLFNMEHPFQIYEGESSNRVTYTGKLLWFNFILRQTTHTFYQGNHLIYFICFCKNILVIVILMVISSNKSAFMNLFEQLTFLLIKQFLCL